MALSRNAQKLADWLGLYKLTGTLYNTYLSTRPKAQRHGAFTSALAELVAGGY